MPVNALQAFINSRSGASMANQLSPQAIQGTNLAYPQYLQDVNTITPMQANANYGGETLRSVPNTVFINPESYINPRETLAHEAAHVQQHEADRFIQKALKEGNYPRTFSIPGTSNNYIVGEGKVPIDRTFRDIQKNAKNLSPEIASKYELSKDFTNSPSEFMADMVSFESSLPKGQTILNTDIGKAIFTTPEQRRAYLSASFPNTTKFLEHSPNSFEIAVDKAKMALTEFKDVSLHDSYIKAALAAIKKLNQ